MTIQDQNTTQWAWYHLEEQKTIFEPYITLKAAIPKSLKPARAFIFSLIITEQHQGQIAVTSDPDMWRLLFISNCHCSSFLALNYNYATTCINCAPAYLLSRTQL